MAKSPKSSIKTSRKRKSRSKDKRSGTRADSKQAKLIEMLKRPDGATIDEIVKKFVKSHRTPTPVSRPSTTPLTEPRPAARSRR
jgi:hypothetical protein